MRGGGRDTQPELSLRREVWALDFRYRLHHRVGRTRPDMAFIGSRLVVFVDGCFWRGRPSHSTTPKSNQDFLGQKLRRNCGRDVETTKTLKSQSWQVLRFREHEVEVFPEDCAFLISSMFGSRGN
uniref:very short patch repair endonuclease n=1 Tax=Alcaligenes faecalis TaxID=511 RepID=UPI003D005B69